MATRLGTMVPFQSLYSKITDSYFEKAKLLLDWLSETNQTCWQVLPLHATTYKKNLNHFLSPYSSYGIGLNPQYLTKKDYETGVNIRAFIRDNSYWVHDYALFIALSRDQQTDNWSMWPEDYRDFDNPQVKIFAEKHREILQEVIREQAILDKRYKELRAYAKSCNLEIWGDMPFYLEPNSPLVWKYKKAFFLNKDGSYEYVAGSPGGEHFRKRQVWGFPLYNYNSKGGLEVVKKLWEMRIDYAAKLYDMTRLDAAVRFFTYEMLHISDPHKDIRRNGPGSGLFTHLVRYSRRRGMDVYIEDISSLDMSQLQKNAATLDIAGISVATMLLPKNGLAVHPVDFDVTKYRKNHIYFSSTHDTAPLVPYLESLTESQLGAIAKELGLDDLKDLSISLRALKIRTFLVRNCRTVLVAMQDWLLTKERVNVPGFIDISNWNYKMSVAVERLPMPIEMQKFLCFDLDGVVISRKQTFGEYYRSLRPQCSGRLSEFFSRVYPRCLVGGSDLKAMLKKQLIVFGWGGTVGELMKLWFDTEYQKKDGKLLELVRRIRKSGLPCYISSDQEKYRSKYLLGKIGANFDGHYFSWEMGALKNNRGYWHAVMKKSQVLPEQIIFVDNNEENIRVARSMGIHAILYTDIGTLRHTLAGLLKMPLNRG